MIRFEFLVLALGLGHSFSSPTFAETKRVPVPIEASSVTTHMRLTHPRLKGRTRTIIGRLIYKFPETDREAQSERNQPSAAFAVFTFGGKVARESYMYASRMPGRTMDPRRAPHKGLPRLGPVEREGGNGRSTKALT